MKPNGALKHFILAFLLALIGYAAFYLAIEYRRTRNGPWQVAFTSSAAGAPLIVIDQPWLRITNLQISFPGGPFPATNAAAATSGPDRSRPGFPVTDHQSPITHHQSPITTLVFAQPQPVPYDVPFGKCVFMDTTFLPGTVTFRLFGHEIELLPRVLIIDHEEHPWQANAIITLPATREALGQAKR